MIKFIIIILFLSIQSFAQQTFYYSGKNYGTEALFNPIYLILNGSYDILQLQNYNRDITKINYKSAMINVFNNLGSPFHQIKKYGYGKFIRTELLPIELTRKGGQWWPNYQLHLVGGGMTYVAIKEWYELNKFPQPTLFALGTVAFYHLLNEVVENSNYKGLNVDAIADIYFFDLGGIILFSFDNVNKFFRDKLNLADWSSQASFMLNDGTLQNNGQNFSIKYEFPFLEQWSLFYYFGMNGLLGVSHSFDDENSLSFGFGLRAKKLLAVNENLHQNTVETTINVGLFYDRNSSLMTSLLYNGLTDNTVQFNMYPGFFSYKGINPGIWIGYRKNGNILFGITTQYLPGIGLKF